jgi:hypothetical protein
VGNEGLSGGGGGVEAVGSFWRSIVEEQQTFALLVLDNIGRDVLRKLQHIDFSLPSDSFESIVTLNHPLVLGALQVLALNVRPPSESAQTWRGERTRPSRCPSRMPRQNPRSWTKRESTSARREDLLVLTLTLTGIARYVIFKQFVSAFSLGKRQNWMTSHQAKEWVMQYTCNEEVARMGSIVDAIERNPGMLAFAFKTECKEFLTFASTSRRK